MSEIQKAADVIKSGGVIAYPTEGVWGLGCDPFNETAVRRICALKERPVEKGLILVAGTLEQTQVVTGSLAPEYMDLLRETWPGPNTWLVPDVDQVIPSWIKGQFETVAIRVSEHPLVVDLCLAAGGMIVSTSANPGEQPPALNQDEVESYFPKGLDMILPGALGGLSGPSQIRDLMSQAVIR